MIYIDVSWYKSAKILSWGPGAAVLVFPMLSIFFIEKSQDPLCSLAYTLGALTAYLLKKRERMEALLDKFVTKLASLGEKVIRLDLPTLPYLIVLSFLVCLTKNYSFTFGGSSIEEQMKDCLRSPP